MNISNERYIPINRNYFDNNKTKICSEKRKSNRNEYKIKYAKENLKRIPLDVNLEMFETINKYISITGESRNGFIKRAINEAIERDNRNG